MEYNKLSSNYLFTFNFIIELVKLPLWVETAVVRVSERKRSMQHILGVVSLFLLVQNKIAK